MFRGTSQVRPGFTLIELLVVIAIISVLMAILLPAIQKVREAANRMLCANHLKQIGLACHNYHGDYSAFPNSGIGIGYGQGTTWAYLLLPYIEQDNLFKSFPVFADAQLPSGYPRYFNTAAANLAANAIPIKTYMCPSRRSGNTVSLGNHWDSVGGNSTTTGTPIKGPALDYAMSQGTNFSANGPNMSARLVQHYGAGCYSNGVLWNGCQLGNGIARDTGINNWINFAYNGPFDNGPTIAEVKDGTSNTFLIGEKHVILGKEGQCGDPNSPEPAKYQMDCGAYNAYQRHGAGATHRRGANGQCLIARHPAEIGHPLAPNFHWSGMYAFGSRHPGVCQFVFCDGSVKAISVTTAQTTLNALSTISGGEVVQGDY